MSNIQVIKTSCDTLLPASFEERSVGIQLISLLLALGGYFIVAGQMLAQGVLALPAYVPLFVVAVVLMVAVMVAGHIAAAVAARPDGRDERDRLIEWRAESNSAWLVGAGVIVGITAMVLAVPNVWVAHLLLLSLFLSEVMTLVLQLVYYRRGL